MCFEGLTDARSSRKARVQVAICTSTASKYANWYGMNVDTKKRRTQVVIMRLLGELGANAGAMDLPLRRLANERSLWRTASIPDILHSHPCRSGGQVIIRKVE